MTLSAIVLTKNEEPNIGDCLAALSWAAEILVVDSGSTDATCDLARKCGAKIFSNPFKDFASQRNFALQKATGNWVLFIDADERVTPELAAEINAMTQGKPRSESGDERCVYAIPRHNCFFGKRLRFSDARGDAPIRLFPRQSAQWTQPVHEKVQTTLPCRWLKNFLLHYSTRDLAHYKQKIRDYVPLELEAMRAKGIRPSVLRMILMPPAKFLHLYLFQLGFLDGLAGFQYAILSAYYALEKHRRYLKQKS